MEKAAVFILLGQSNAVGHGIVMSEDDKIKEPLKNVFGLTRDFNQSYDIEKLRWSGYTSSGTNLGESQDDTYSVANCMAALWQKEIDRGEKLPDLYIIHISVGAQGVAEERFMWYPDRAKILNPGPLSSVNISLCPLSEHIFSLIKKSFEEMGKTPEFMGIHWRGGEQDTLVPMEKLTRILKSIYQTIFERFYNALGEKVPVVLHKITHEERSKQNNVVECFYYINEIFDELSRENDNIEIFDVCKAPFYNSDTADRGLMGDDIVHYTPKTNQWVAQQIIIDYKSKNQSE